VINTSLTSEDGVHGAHEGNNAGHDHSSGGLFNTTSFALNVAGVEVWPNSMIERLSQATGRLATSFSLAAASFNTRLFFSKIPQVNDADFGGMALNGFLNEITFFGMAKSSIDSAGPVHLGEEGINGMLPGISRKNARQPHDIPRKE
jgi:hypothetical protein